MWHRPAGLALAVVLAALSAAAAARTDPAVVGYIPPQVAYGALTPDGELAADQLQAQGLVVANLEPTNTPDTGQAGCPTEGCAYQLIVTDPAAVRAAANNETAPPCGTGGYGVVDADPDVADVDGARLYTGRGALPTHTAETATAQTPRPMTAGVGQLCFAATTGDAEPVAVTQPVPIVILSPGHPDERAHLPGADDPEASGHPAQRRPGEHAPIVGCCGCLPDHPPRPDATAPSGGCRPPVVDILTPITAP